MSSAGAGYNILTHDEHSLLCVTNPYDDLTEPIEVVVDSLEHEPPPPQPPPSPVAVRASASVPRPPFQPASSCFSDPADACCSSELLLAQQLMIEAYIDLRTYNVLNLTNGFAAEDRLTRMTRGHAAQDPVGALFVALLMLRLHPPRANALHREASEAPQHDPTACEKSPRAGDISPTGVADLLLLDDRAESLPQKTDAKRNLCADEREAVGRSAKKPRISPCVEQALAYGYRIRMASLITTAHKFVTCAPLSKNSGTMLATITRFLTSREQPKWQHEIEHLLSVHAANEFWLTTRTPLLRLVHDNPLTRAEESMEQLIASKAINRDLAVIFRGIFPFFLFSAMYNPSNPVLELLANAFSETEMGEGLLGAATACAEASTPLRIRHDDWGDAEKYIASVFVDSAARFGDQLRDFCESFDKSSGLSNNFSRHAQQLLSPRVLAAAYERLGNA